MEKLTEILKEVGIDLTEIIKKYGAWFIVVALLIYAYKKLKD